jgi:hypothetical protein
LVAEVALASVLRNNPGSAKRVVMNKEGSTSGSWVTTSLMLHVPAMMQACPG